MNHTSLSQHYLRYHKHPNGLPSQFPPFVLSRTRCRTRLPMTLPSRYPSLPVSPSNLLLVFLDPEDPRKHSRTSVGGRPHVSSDPSTLWVGSRSPEARRYYYNMDRPVRKLRNDMSLSSRGPSRPPDPLPPPRVVGEVLSHH